MGTWGAGLFDDDISMDVQAEFEASIEEGMSIKEATKLILASFEEVLTDDDESPIVYLTIAALQLDKGSVQKRIKKRALDIIKSGEGLERWKEARGQDRDIRLNILHDLEIRLTIADS